MSLSRTALRLAVIEALAPTPQAGVATIWPTLAARNVFDSDVGPVPATDAEGCVPRIEIYTDDSKIERLEGQRSLDTSSDGEQTVSLALELFIPGRGLDEAGNEIVSLTARTDALAEGMLDLLSAQIDATINRARMDGPLRLVLTSIRKIETRGWRDGDTDVRIASHRLEYEMVLHKQGPIPATGTGFDRLPSPLREVATELPENSYGAGVCLALAAAITSPEALPALQAVRMNMRLDGTTTETTGEAGNLNP
jgi:hypothetical protein